MAVARGWGVKDKGNVGQRVQIFSYKKNRFWDYNVQHDDIVNNTVLYPWKLPREHPKPFHHTFTHEESTMCSDECIQYPDLGNHSTVYIKCHIV